MMRFRGLATLALLALATSCLSAPTESAPATVIVRGSWSYVSVQSGSPTTANGTLTLSQDSTVRFTGTLDANEQDTQGLLRRIAGVISGHTIDASLIEFDMVIDPLTNRRHSGAVKGDSLTGSWVQISDAAGGIAASGTFRARRVR
jgi:ABC-type transport system substrate-binding protein